MAQLKKHKLIAIRYGDGMNRIIFPRYQAKRKPTGKAAASWVEDLNKKAEIKAMIAGLADKFSNP